MATDPPADAPPVIDAHTHVACPDTDRFPQTPWGVGSTWWQAGGGSVDELLATMDGAGVSRAVVVQAIGVYGYDCACAAHAAAAHPDRLTLVATVDMTGPDPAAALGELAGRARADGAALAGVRIFGVGPAPTDWLTDARGREVWAAAADLGLVVVPTIFADKLGQLGALAAEVPRAVVALDHCGFPDPSDPDQVAAVLDLAGVPSVHLKVTSHVLTDAEAHGDPADLVDALAGAFGADRLCWGSDHPQHQAHDYPGMLALARHGARRLDAPARERFFSGTSLALWWPGGAG